MNTKELKEGIRDGFPICLGYISVSMAFGLTVVKSGMPIWSAILISLTNLTSAGQFAGISLIFAGAGYLASDFIPEQAKSLFLCIGIGSCILVALLNVISFSAAKANKKQKTVKESNDFFNERRDNALEDITKVIKLKGTFNYRKQMYKILNEMIENQVQIRDITRDIRLSTKVNFDIYSFTV